MLWPSFAVLEPHPRHPRQCDIGDPARFRLGVLGIASVARFGSIRRECLDDFVIFREAHLRRVLAGSVLI